MSEVLLLGMVFSEEIEPKRGQEYRDRVRCEALEKLGYSVRTLDNKHKDDVLTNGKHCTANFADSRRMLKSMNNRWEKSIFEHIILDYFFSPVGWARERWTASFFSKTLPAIATENILSPTGKIWLPNLQCIEESLEDNSDVIKEHFTVRLISDAKENPLFAATENVTEELLRCPDNLTNETQMKPLLSHSSRPFYVLELKERLVKEESEYVTDAESAVLGNPSLLTPTKKRKARALKG